MGEIEKKTKTMTRRSSWEDLPDVCWESIFARLDHHPCRLEPLSLVCKRFLSITHLLRTTLILPSPASVYLPHSRLYSRFSNLKCLHLCHAHPSLDCFVRELARSKLPLQSLHLSHQSHFPRKAMRLLGESTVMRNTLKTLSCTHFDCLTDDDLFVVADCFPYLHRLDLDHNEFTGRKRTITDQGFCAISVRLTSLLSMLICVSEDVSIRSIESLSSNCPLLRGFKAGFGVGSSISLDNFASFASLTYLDLGNVIIHDSGFVKLSAANLKLEKLVLRSPYSRGSRKGESNGAAMCRFLKSCRSLRHLKLKFMLFTKDTSALDFVDSIPNVRVIELCNVRLPTAILFDLLESCPNLEEIIWTLAYVEIVEYIGDAPVHHRLRKLVLTGGGLCDETLMVIAPICPNLEYFYVEDVPEVTKRGIDAIMASCCNIKICKRITSYSKCWKKMV